MLYTVTNSIPKTDCYVLDGVLLTACLHQNGSVWSHCYGVMKEHDQQICILTDQRCGAMTGSFNSCLNDINVCIPWWLNDRHPLMRAIMSALFLSRDKKSSFLPENSVSAVTITIGAGFFFVSDLCCLLWRDLHHSHRTPLSLVRIVTQWSLQLHYMSLPR